MHDVTITVTIASEDDVAAEAAADEVEAALHNVASEQADDQVIITVV